ncbi:MAG: glycosyltransferase [Candidatus Aenigmarchaeota archaeon]|nr:glycosyltransferase [Candidatus Aenigmarchaeota archaeon]
MRYSIVIPAFNEEKRIKSTLENYGKEFRKNTEIIIVNNGSTDNTEKIVRSMRKKFPQIKLLNFPIALGKGGAVKEGFKIAKGSIIGFVDSDDSIKIKGIKKLIEYVRKNKCDCAIASKWKNKKFKEVDEPFFRKIASRVWNIIIRILFGLKIYDTQAGGKFMKSSVLKEIFKKMNCSGYEFDVELLWLIKRAGFSIKEVYISFVHREESKFKMKNSITMLIDIMKIRFGVEKCS